MEEQECETEMTRFSYECFRSDIDLRNYAILGGCDATGNKRYKFASRIENERISRVVWSLVLEVYGSAGNNMVYSKSFPFRFEGDKIVAHSYK